MTLTERSDATRQLPPVSIFLVEDEPGDRELMTIALNRSTLPHEVQTVEDGVQALSYLRREPPYADAVRPSLIILDLNLPRMDGREVLREIKKDEALRDIPIIVLSTSYDDGDVAASYRLGACSYIVKPGNFRDFNAAVQHLVDYWFATVTLPRGR